MLSENVLHVLTDQSNLLFLFAPLVVLPNAGNRVVSKVQIWAIFLSCFSLSIGHIYGHKNEFADMLTFWGKSYRSEWNPIQSIQVCSLAMMNKELLLTENEIKWPDLDEFKHS